MARKPLVGTVASNVAQYGTGAINVDGCRIDLNGESWEGNKKNAHGDYSGKVLGSFAEQYAKPSHPAGRWPANVVLDEDAAAMFPESRFFYVAKASRREREAGLEGMPERIVGAMNNAESSGRDGSNPANAIGGAQRRVERGEPATMPARNVHPTVKPIALMRWLCRLVTPPNGLVLDPFTGSGSTGCAAVLEGFRFVGIEREPEYAAIAEKRIAHWAGQVETPEPSLFDG